MKFNLITPTEITDYEKLINCELVVAERDDPSLPRYYVVFEFADIKDGISLVGAHGNGNSIDQALSDYCKRISGNTLVIRAFSKERREILVPQLIHTKFLFK
jgi:hypothetical protein